MKSEANTKRFIVVRDRMFILPAGHGPLKVVLAPEPSHAGGKTGLSTQPGGNHTVVRTDISRSNEYLFKVVGETLQVGPLADMPGILTKARVVRE